MLHLGINEFIRNIRRNLMIILQLAVILVLSVLIVSVYGSQTRMSRAVMKYIDDTGIYYSPNIETMQSSEEEFLEGVTEVENIIYARTAQAGEHEGDKLVTSFFLTSYDEDKIPYRPQLKSGKWYDEVKPQEGVIPIVVAENEKGYTVGDVIETEIICNGEPSRTVKLKITGIVYDRTMLFGLNDSWSNIESNHSYLDLFECAYNMKGGIAGVPSVYGVMSAENVEKYNLFCPMTSGIIDFQDDITEETMEANKEILKERCVLTDTAAMAKNSKMILFHKISGIVVVFVVLLLITLTSIVCSGAVTFLYERRNYGIYFITGNSWKNTILLSLVHWGMICFTSVLLSGVLLGFGMLRGWMDQYTIVFSWLNVLAYLAIIAVTILTALVIPINILRKSQPVQILKNNMED